jgi:hypothetical protein
MDPLQQGFHTLVSTLTGVGMTRVETADRNAGFLALFRQLGGQEQGFLNADLLIKLFLDKTRNANANLVVKAILSGDYDNQPPFPNLKFSQLARSLSFFVLTGMWSPTCSSEDAVIPAPAAYTEGLIWLIAQTHPVGNSKSAAGSWAVPPPPLSKFIGT